MNDNQTLSLSFSVPTTTDLTSEDKARMRELLLKALEESRYFPRDKRDAALIRALLTES